MEFCLCLRGFPPGVIWVFLSRGMPPNLLMAMSQAGQRGIVEDVAVVACRFAIFPRNLQPGCLWDLEGDEKLPSYCIYDIDYFLRGDMKYPNDKCRYNIPVPWILIWNILRIRRFVPVRRILGHIIFAVYKVGPHPVISRVITPFIGIITPVTHL